MPQNTKRKILKIKSSMVFTLLIILFLTIFPAPFYADDNPLSRYLNEKALSNYENAIGIIQEWSVKEKDPVTIETNIFRIYELVKYPELIGNAINAYNNMLGNKTVYDDPLLRSRINIFLNILYIRKGDMREAAALRNSLGFIERYKIFGPFKENGNYNKAFLPEAELSRDDSEKYASDIGNAECYDVQTDFAGKIDAEDLLGNVSGSVFYFKSTIYVSSDGGYVLHLGKTGYTDLWIDGHNVFSDRLKHGFSFDQYCIKLLLSKGKHVLLLKVGASDSGLKFALRLTDAEGRPVNNVHNKDWGGNSAAAKCKVENISFFNALEKLIQIKNMSMQTAFNAGYLYYISGINSEEEGEAKILFSQVKNSGLRSASCYYLGLLERGGKREICFRESLKAFKTNVEAINGIAEIEFGNNKFSSAYEFSEKIREINPQSFYINKLNARIFETAGWNNEALKESNAPRNRIDSSGHEIKASVYLKNKKYKEAGDMYKRLHDMDRLNTAFVDNLLECYIKAGRYNEARGLLAQCAELYPNNVSLRLKHAELMENTNGIASALPYLLSARKISPCNKDVLLHIALLYHKLNKKDLTLLYLNKALEYDPGNKWIVGYVEYLKGQGFPPNPIMGGLKERLPLYATDNTRVISGNKSDSRQPVTGHSSEGLNAKSPPNGGVGGRSSSQSLKHAIFKSLRAGNHVELYNNIEKLLSAFPAEPESALYYPEVAKHAGSVGYQRCMQTLQKIIGIVNNNTSSEKKELLVLLLKLELEKLLYQTSKPEAPKLSEEFFPVRRWLLSGPYKKYGPADIDYPFMPEIVTDLQNSDIKKKEITIQNAKGELDFGKYLYPGTGVVYAATTISCANSVKIRIYSDSQYTIFINGKETIRNHKNGIFRSCRIVKVKDSTKISLMVKMYLKGCRSSLRVLVTDENDSPVKTDAGTSEFVFSDFKYSEEPDFPYAFFADLKNENNSGRKDAEFNLGRYFHNLQSSEAVKYYREALLTDQHNPVKSFYLAECLLDLSDGDKESARYLEGMEIMNHLSGKDLTPPPPLSQREKGAYSPSPSGRGGWGVRSHLDYACKLLNAGYEKEFESEINYLKKNYPYSIEPLLLLASYYKDRNLFKSIGIYKKILSEQRCEVALKELISIYNNQGKYYDIISLTGKYDTENIFRKELIQAYIDLEDYDNAKKEIFHGLAEKDDPYFNIKLGVINYIHGFDPAMYWQKALSIEPGNTSLRNYLNYLETGKVNDSGLANAAYSERGHENILSGIKDIRDFAIWYNGLLKDATEIDRAHLPHFTGTGQDEQIKEVYGYVSSSIAFNGRDLFFPHKTNDTLYKKRGSVEDKTVLASAMLAELELNLILLLRGWKI